MATSSEDVPPLNPRDSFISEHDGDFDIDTTVQMSGMLWKKPFGGKKKHKWQKRCVVSLNTCYAVFMSSALKVLCCKGRISALLCRVGGEIFPEEQSLQHTSQGVNILAAIKSASSFHLVILYSSNWLHVA